MEHVAANRRLAAEVLLLARGPAPLHDRGHVAHERQRARSPVLTPRAPEANHAGRAIDVGPLQPRNFALAPPGGEEKARHASDIRNSCSRHQTWHAGQNARVTLRTQPACSVVGSCGLSLEDWDWMKVRYHSSNTRSA